MTCNYFPFSQLCSLLEHYNLKGTAKVLSPIMYNCFLLSWKLSTFNFKMYKSWDKITQSPRSRNHILQYFYQFPLYLLYFPVLYMKIKHKFITYFIMIYEEYNTDKIWILYLNRIYLYILLSLVLLKVISTYITPYLWKTKSKN